MSDRVEDIRRKIEKREGVAGYEANVEALKAELKRLLNG